MIDLSLALALVLAYLLGSIPTGLWLGLRLRNVDIRQFGSKNIGATNTMRVLGKKLGALALLGDMGKGLVSVLLIARLSSWQPYAQLACGLAAIIGHTASVFVRFRGGKGVATAAGVYLGLCPVPTLIALAAFLIVLAVTRMVSAGSITAAVVLCAVVFLFPSDGYPYPYVLALRIITVLVAALVIWKHRSNIARILKGQENRIGKSPHAGNGSV